MISGLNFLFEQTADTNKINIKLYSDAKNIDKNKQYNLKTRCVHCGKDADLLFGLSSNERHIFNRNPSNMKNNKYNLTDVTSITNYYCQYCGEMTALSNTDKK